MATQMHPRLAKRMPCSVAAGHQRHGGLVLNLSQGGLFVQTSAATPAGEAIQVSLSPPDGGESIPVQARVVWRRVVPQQLRTSARGGLGLRIEQADERYFQRLADWMRVEMPRPQAAPESSRLARPDESPDFFVRVRAGETRRSRRLGIVARDREEAERTALDAVGPDWRVIEVRPRR